MAETPAARLSAALLLLMLVQPTTGLLFPDRHHPLVAAVLWVVATVLGRLATRWMRGR